MDIDAIMDDVVSRNPGQPEFHQAVREVLESIIPVIARNPRYAVVLQRLLVPDKVHRWTVAWKDDNGNERTNKGWRVQWNNTLGPYKGGLRFHPGVNEGVLKFLAFEQTFKNALTGLALGGGKGGSDFDPKGRSGAEIKRFCQAFVAGLASHIGPTTDVPAGDIGVGSREIGWMVQEYQRLTGKPASAFTGKALELEGSMLRTEATGYGAGYFADEMMARVGKTLKDKRCVVSGSGNVAQFTAEKLIQLGAKVVTLSDSDGTIVDEAGIDAAKLAFVKELKNVRRGRIAECAAAFGCRYVDGGKPWSVRCDIAFPAATQNELDVQDAILLIANGCTAVVECANMPCTAAAVEHFRTAGISVAPGKAVNAGGVAVSGLEMEQNRLGERWSAEQVDTRLKAIMQAIHAQCVMYGRDKSTGSVDYIKGANIAGFLRVADAMIE
jgi:glutamate dehydrogenase (NADP+)